MDAPAVTSPMRLARELCFVAFASVAACGGSPASVNEDAGEVDGTSAVDGSSGADATSDAQEADAAVGCGVLPAEPADVFVDAMATASQEIGTASCPFRTIGAALALSPPTSAAPRVVHVKGGAPAVSYIEPVRLALPPYLTLEGDGADRVTIGGIGGGGPCAIVVSPSCTLTVAGGATARTVTVTSATGTAVEVTSGTGAARIEGVIATHAKQMGFAARADVVLLQAAALDNDGDGLDARTGVVTVTDSEFRLNAGHGLDIDIGATLVLTGGKVHNNDGRGIFLHNGTQFTVLPHSVTNADIQQNLFAGIDVAANASLTLRGTTMYQNEFGVLFEMGTNALDLGTANDPGNNVFGGTAAGHANARAGLCMQSTKATPTQVVEGNTWRVCPPPQRKITGPFCSSNNTYSDIAYVPAVATYGAPALAPATCTVGP